ncbi:hypothetical protein SAMN05518849_101540 [Sphingobium sp. AP50]|uniref:hypothetical protein n=1 Tax=Sphingobium sp. AP50 TaxID=1884369 RepID=UPI0008C54E10|nr:hypothetical protein [Sphingobium sp. AP50]SEI68152.1 hypothetical protein SAMN05518849_101540 [Sphingobium sp. AP50]
MKKIAVSVFYFFGLLALVASAALFWRAEGTPISFSLSPAVPAANNTAIAGIYYGLAGDLLIAGAILLATGALISFMTRHDSD